MTKLKKFAIALGVFYAICLALGAFRIPEYLGVVGMTPIAFFGHKSSIEYIFDYYSFDNRNHYLSNYWKYRGAQTEIPEFQRLYGESLLETDRTDGLVFLSRAANSGDYYAAAILARIYSDSNSKFKDKSLALQYENLARKLKSSL